MLDVHRVALSLPDGRELEVLEAGERDWPLVVIHNGTPMGAGFLAQHLIDAEQRRLRLVSYSRPGYGGSTRLPGRDVAQAASDAAAICDHLGAERFATWGISGGGPHALACAALLPHRVVAAASLAAVAPYDLMAAQFMAGMGEDNVAEFSAALAGQENLAAFMAPVAKRFAQADVAESVDAMRTLLSPQDVEVFTGAFGEDMVRAMQDGLRSGFYGWFDDDLAFTGPWGFALTDIEVPVQIWQGRHDLMVPYAHGLCIADAIPGAESRLSDTDGHLTLYARRVPEVHDWMARQLKAAP